MHMQMSYYGHTYQVPVLSFLAPHQGASSLTLPPTVAQNFELHNAFAHIIAHQLAGQNVHVTVRDCAAAGGYCALNVVGMNAWLADHLYFDCTVSAFFYPNHGKMLVSRASQPCPGRATRSTLATLLRCLQCDSDFGHCDVCWRGEDVFNADTMMLPLTRLKYAVVVHAPPAPRRRHAAACTILWLAIPCSRDFAGRAARTTRGFRWMRPSTTPLRWTTGARCSRSSAPPPRRATTARHHSAPPRRATAARASSAATTARHRGARQHSAPAAPLPNHPNPPPSSRFEIPLDTAVRLTATKPLIFVYWGKHIKNAEEARSKLPDGWLGNYLARFFPSEKPPGGGWLGMQRFEGDPITFEYIYRATPAYAPPPPRVRLLSEVKGLVASGKLLNEVVIKHLQSASVDTGGNMEARVERLVALGPSALQAAVDESAKVRADKKAAKRTKAPAAAAPATVVATAVAGPAGLEVEADEAEEEGAGEEEEEEASRPTAKPATRCILAAPYVLEALTIPMLQPYRIHPATLSHPGPFGDGRSRRGRRRA